MATTYTREQLETCTVPNLRETCKGLGLSNYSKARKSVLIDMILAEAGEETAETIAEDVATAADAVTTATDAIETTASTEDTTDTDTPELRPIEESFPQQTNVDFSGITPVTRANMTPAQRKQRQDLALEHMNRNRLPKNKKAS